MAIRYKEWKELFLKVSPRPEDELGIIFGVEDLCTSSLAVGKVLKEGGCRFLLQTLFDMDFISEEAILKCGLLVLEEVARGGPRH